MIAPVSILKKMVSPRFTLIAVAKPWMVESPDPVTSHPVSPVRQFSATIALAGVLHAASDDTESSIFKTVISCWAGVGVTGAAGDTMTPSDSGIDGDSMTGRVVFSVLAIPCVVAVVNVTVELPALNDSVAGTARNIGRTVNARPLSDRRSR
jgi:hypothetical protein